MSPTLIWCICVFNAENKCLTWARYRHMCPKNVHKKENIFMICIAFYKSITRINKVYNYVWFLPYLIMNKGPYLNLGTSSKIWFDIDYELNINIVSVYFSRYVLMIGKNACSIWKNKNHVKKVISFHSAFEYTLYRKFYVR